MKKIILLLVASVILASSGEDSAYRRTDREITSGVTMISLSKTLPPCEIRIVKFDLKKNPRLRLGFPYGVTASGGRKTPEQLAKDNAAAHAARPIAAINGDFFLFEESAKRKPARPFGLSFEDGRLLDAGCWGTSGYEVIARRTDGSLGFGKISSSTNSGHFTAATDGKEITDAIRVWNRPLQQGRVFKDLDHVCYPVDNRPCYPRTLVGLGADLVVFLVADARQPLWSMGITSEEAARLLKQEGCTDAGQFDGGGSTALWLDGIGYANRPSDGKPRAVANGLAIYELKQRQ